MEPGRAHVRRRFPPHRHLHKYHAFLPFSFYCIFLNKTRGNLSSPSFVFTGGIDFGFLKRRDVNIRLYILTSCQVFSCFRWITITYVLLLLSITGTRGWCSDSTNYLNLRIKSWACYTIFHFFWFEQGKLDSRQDGQHRSTAKAIFTEKPTTDKKIQNLPNFTNNTKLKERERKLEILMSCWNSTRLSIYLFIYYHINQSYVTTISHKKGSIFPTTSWFSLSRNQLATLFFFKKNIKRTKPD